MEKGRYPLQDAYPTSGLQYSKIIHDISGIFSSMNHTETFYPPMKSTCSMCTTNLDEAFETLTLQNVLPAKETNHLSSNHLPSHYTSYEGFAVKTDYTTMNNNIAKIDDRIQTYQQQLTTYQDMDQKQNPLLHSGNPSVYDVLESDVQENLLYENMMYMTGVVLIASMLIGAIYATTRTTSLT
jgi:hypothetical protein